jgi:pimeloyl-ACP methyl ester carboxylesterase
MALEHETARAACGEVALFYRRLGAQNRALTPLLIAHGLSYFSYDWLEVAEPLALEREVVCMDLRGFGDSDWSAQEDYSVPAMGADVLNLLAHLAWGKAVLLGHSMGARGMIFAAAKHPEHAAGLVLVDYTPENAPAGSRRVAQSVAGTPDRFASVEEAMHYFQAPASARERFENYLRPAEGGFIVKRDPYFQRQFRQLVEIGEPTKPGPDMWQLLGEVKCPILSIRGARSDLYAPETVAKMKAANSRLSVVEVDAGHNVAGENPHGLCVTLHPFLASLEETHDRST